MTTEDIYITTRDGEKRGVSWEELTQLDKDILWVFDQCVGDFHNPFIPDHSFKIKYWEYLRLNLEWFDNKQQRSFYSQGILIVILCMTVEYLDTVSGNQRHFDNTEIADVINCVNDFEPSSSDERKFERHRKAWS